MARGVKTLDDHIEGIAEKLTQWKGNVTRVAEFFSVCRTTMNAFIQSHPILIQTTKDAREARLDRTEDKLGDAIESGEGWAVCFMLKTLGKSRGYIETHDHTGKFAHDHQQTNVPIPSQEVILANLKRMIENANNIDVPTIVGNLTATGRIESPPLNSWGDLDG